MFDDNKDEIMKQDLVKNLNFSTQEIILKYLKSQNKDE